MKQKRYVQIEYKVIEKGVCITKLHGRCAEVRIPEKIDGMSVVEIGERAFAVKAEAPVAEPADEREAEIIFAMEAPEEIEEGQALRRVFLPDSVEKIGTYAFHGCSALERVSLPAKLEAISVRMFDGCASLEQITLPAGLKGIEDYAFYGCGSLKKLRLPESVDRIGKYAFYNCRKMEEINIPLATTDLNMGMFLNCDALKYLSFGRCRHISDLIAGLNHELHLTIDFPQENGETETCRLLIPDFQYE